jgi:hypothetical protein
MGGHRLAISFVSAPMAAVRHAGPVSASSGAGQPGWAPVVSPQPSRRGLVLETWFVQAAFLVPGVLAAVDLLAAHLGGAGTLRRIPLIVTGHPVVNLVLATLTYFQVAVVVPLALLLLNRTGQDLAAVVPVAIILSPLMASNKALFAAPAIGHMPKYYILYGVAASAVTAITEETLVSGYLLIRLDQLGWNPRWALVLSLSLRTSYHVYYGLGFLLTIPFGYFATRSFQIHRRLMRPVLAHFLYDATLFTIAVLVS